MKRLPGPLIVITLFLGLLLLMPALRALRAADAPGGAESTKPEPKPKPIPSQEELEATFKATLTKATMTGRWCSIVKDGKGPDAPLKLGPEKAEKYTIVGVSKLSGDSWVVRARIQYGKMDFVAPVPVQVKWAGDTPVIIVDNVSLGGGAYSARVLVYEKTYAGTWTGGDHGGLLNGIITQDTKKEEEAEKP